MGRRGGGGGGGGGGGWGDGGGEGGAEVLAISATEVSSMPECSEGDAHGILVGPDPGERSKARARMSSDPARRAQMAGAARKRLMEQFGMDAGIDLLMARLKTGLR